MDAGKEGKSGKSPKSGRTMKNQAVDDGPTVALTEAGLERCQMLLAACLHRQSELVNRYNDLSQQEKRLEQEKEELDQLMVSLLDLPTAVTQLKQKVVDLQVETEAQTIALGVDLAMPLYEGPDTNYDHSVKGTEDTFESSSEEEWEEEGEEDAKKDKTKMEPETIQVDEELALFKQYDTSLDRAVITVRHGTVERLVSCLYTPYGHDVPNYVETFLLTYRSFISPEQLLESLISAYPVAGGLRISTDKLPTTGEKARGESATVTGTLKLSGDEEGNSPTPDSDTNVTQKRARVSNFLRKWTMNSRSDFLEDDERLKKRYEAWLSSGTFDNKDHKGIAKLLSKALQKAVDGESLGSTVFSEKPPVSIQPKKTNFSLLDIDAKELARQITLVCSRLYNSIQPWECLGQSWNKKDKEKRAPNITGLTRRFNNMSRWISTQIVSEMNLRRRAQVLDFFIRVGEELNELNNFHGITEIISGLQSAAVFRLKKTWELVKKSRHQSLQRLGQFISRESSYKSYREALHDRNPPIIPYIGVYLSDLTFLEDGNKDFTSGDQVNFHKRIMISNVIKEIKTYQQMPYNIEEIESIQRYVDETMTMSLDDNQLYDYSVKCEPRQQS
mmetsp:Transcript_32085/g.89814  ORF Transcript_32085/g.89814 Transcript_32085/m.89814 type:complete len:616 (+) Transcript_32085:50-1897(+)